MKQRVSIPFLLIGLLSFLAAGLAIRNGWTVFELVKNVPIPFDTDEADHANAALELYVALNSYSLPAILHAITRQAFYPPVYSVFVAASYLFSGPTLSASRMPSLLFLFAGALILIAAIFRIVGKSKEKILFAASAVFLLFTTSPVLQENAALCMLELCGVCVTSILLYVSTFAPTTRRNLFLIALCLLLTLTKYSFGAMIVPAVFFWIGFLEQESNLKEKIVRSCVVTSAYLLPILIWLSITRTSSVLKFFTSHPSYTPLWGTENIFFDFHSWIFFYNSSVIIGGVTILTTLWSLLRRHTGSQRTVKQLAYLMVANSFLLLLLSSTNEVRHFIVAAPPLWFLSVLCFIDKNSSTPIHRAFRILFLIALISFGFVQSKQIRPLIITGLEGRTEYDQLLEAAAKLTNPLEPTLVIGSFDQIGVEALQWYSARQYDVPYTKVLMDAYPYRADKNYTQDIRIRNIDRWYVDPSFPTELPEILKTGYYKSAIIIRKIGEKSENSGSVTSALQTLSALPKKQKVFGDRELTVVELKAP